MSTGKGRTGFFLALSFFAIPISACDTSDRNGGTPPVAMVSPTPTTTYTPTMSPTPSSSPTLTPFDQDFLMNVARDNMMETQLGNLAAQKSSSVDVKRFGQKIVTDHTQAAQRLNQLATSLNFTLPEQLKPEQKMEISRLETASGKDFDREFLKMMLSDHMKEISEFERVASQATNPDVKQFATQLLPVLSEHAKMAREVAAKIGVKISESH